jgi:hypothetical protein
MEPDVMSATLSLRRASQVFGASTAATASLVVAVALLFCEPALVTQHLLLLWLASAAAGALVTLLHLIWSLARQAHRAARARTVRGMSNSLAYLVLLLPTFLSAGLVMQSAMAAMAQIMVTYAAYTAARAAIVGYSADLVRMAAVYAVTPVSARYDVVFGGTNDGFRGLDDLANDHFSMPDENPGGYGPSGGNFDHGSMFDGGPGGWQGQMDRINAKAKYANFATKVSIAWPDADAPVFNVGTSTGELSENEKATLLAPVDSEPDVDGNGPCDTRTGGGLDDARRLCSERPLTITVQFLYACPVPLINDLFCKPMYGVNRALLLQADQTLVNHGVPHPMPPPPDVPAGRLIPGY